MERLNKKNQILAKIATKRSVSNGVSSSMISAVKNGTCQLASIQNQIKIKKMQANPSEKAAETELLFKLK